MEHQSAGIATLLAILVLVVSTPVALFLLRSAADLAEGTRAWIEENPERIPALRFLSLELVGTSSVRAAVSASLHAGRLIGQMLIVYAWLVGALSLFEPTRARAARLTEVVFGPLTAALMRIGGAIPAVLVSLVAIGCVLILLRFLGLFFASVARGDTAPGWLSKDVVAPTGVLVRAAVALVFAASVLPQLVGSERLAVAGWVLLGVLGVASMPVIASAAIGTATLFMRRLRVGEFAEVGRVSGRVRRITLLEVLLEDADGAELRVPHLLTLFVPMVRRGRAPVVELDVTVPATRAIELRALLVDAAGSVGVRPDAALVSVGHRGARFRVCARSAEPEARLLLCRALLARLGAAGVLLPIERRQR